MVQLRSAWTTVAWLSNQVLPNFVSLVPRLLRGTWLWDKLLPLQHLESDCPWVSAWSAEEWLPLTTCGHRKPCFIKMSPPPPISLFIDSRKPGVCLKGSGIQTKEPLPPTSYPGPVYRKSPTFSALPGQHCRPDLGAEQKLSHIPSWKIQTPRAHGPCKHPTPSKGRWPEICALSLYRPVSLGSLFVPTLLGFCCFMGHASDFQNFIDSMPLLSENPHSTC